MKTSPIEKTRNVCVDDTNLIFGRPIWWTWRQHCTWLIKWQSRTWWACWVTLLMDSLGCSSQPSKLCLPTSRGHHSHRPHREWGPLETGLCFKRWKIKQSYRVVGQNVQHILLHPWLHPLTCAFHEEQLLRVGGGKDLKRLRIISLFWLCNNRAG